VRMHPDADEIMRRLRERIEQRLIEERVVEQNEWLSNMTRYDSRLKAQAFSEVLEMMEREGVTG
jgi:hypothetical protein